MFADWIDRHDPGGELIPNDPLHETCTVLFLALNGESLKWWTEFRCQFGRFGLRDAPDRMPASGTICLHNGLDKTLLDRNYLNCWWNSLLDSTLPPPRFINFRSNLRNESTSVMKPQHPPLKLQFSRISFAFSLGRSTSLHSSGRNASNPVDKYSPLKSPGYHCNSFQPPSPPHPSYLINFNRIVRCAAFWINPPSGTDNNYEPRILIHEDKSVGVNKEYQEGRKEERDAKKKNNTLKQIIIDKYKRTAVTPVTPATAVTRRWSAASDTDE